jgi:hypothetical protein
METTTKIIMEASFRRRGAWMKYFDKRNNLFETDKLQVILDVNIVAKNERINVILKHS